jgi:hypothetical protein
LFLASAAWSVRSFVAWPRVWLSYEPGGRWHADVQGSLDGLDEVVETVPIVCSLLESLDSGESLSLLDGSHGSLGSS